MATMFVCVMISLTAVGGDAPARPPASWRFVEPAPGDAFEHAPFRALVVAREKPAELIEKVLYRGEPGRRRYARLRFGSPSSTRVTVVVDTRAAGEVDLYVDADRNLRIDDRDLVALAAPAGPRRERIWRLPLNVALVEGDTVRTIPRAVVFRLGASGQTLAYAAAGFLEGKATIGGPERARSSLFVRRVDGDGNGLLADAQDLLWLDLNGDGSFDPGSEQFLFAPVLDFERARYVVRSDESGSRLALEPLVGGGTLRVSLGGDNPTASKKVVEIHATAISRDGSVVGLTGTEPAAVPAGEYRLATVTLALDDSVTGQRWSFVFSDAGARAPSRWFTVGKGAAVVVDPIGTPTLEIAPGDLNRTVAPGHDAGLRPALYTGDGLLIVAAYCGDPVAPAVQEILGARIALLAADGTTLATAHSGFS